ncbi:MAG: lipopolysaccharide heptosyltransferase I, partial [Mesorhizobium sp.]
MKVLIVKTSSMGDVIHTFPAVEDARRNRPDLSFDWCVEEAFAGVATLHPAIDRIHTVAIRRWRKALLDSGTWREAAALRRTLRDCRYDLVIDAQGLLKSA